MSDIAGDEEHTQTVDGLSRAGHRELDAGTRVDRFVVLEKVGAGSMGMVYAAFDPRLRRQIALKLVRGDHGSRNGPDRGTDRLLREAQAMAQLSHPRVLQALDFGSWPGGVFIAMELLPGPDLKGWLATERRSWREILEIFLEAGDGLAAAHEAGVVHRDFKMSNVVLGDDGRPRVADFGLAESLAGRPRSAPGESPTAGPSDCSSRRVGTPTYLAPEVFAGQPHDPASDLFSYCVALSRALYARHPFAAKNGEIPAHLTAVHYHRPHYRHVPEWLGRALDRGLAEDPASRWPSMKALLVHLRTTRARRRARWTRAASVLAVSGLIGAWTVLGPRRGVERCSGVTQPLEKVWSDQRLAVIGERFSTSERLHAQPTWQRARDLLVTHADRWRVTAATLCAASEAGGEMAAEVWLLRKRCLMSRMDEFDTLLTLFEDADPVVVDRSLQATESLGSIELCADIVDDPRGGDPDPRHDSPGPATRGLLARSRILAAAGRWDDALDIARQAVETAAGHTLIEAEAQFRLGTVLNTAERPEQAAEALAEAIRLADAGGDDLLRARALSSLMFVRGFHLLELRQADAMSSAVESVLTRLGWPREMELEYRYHRATIFYRHANFASAEVELARSLELRQEIYGSDHTKTANVLFEMGRVAQAEGRIHTAMQRFRRSAEIHRHRLGRHHPDFARSQSSYGYSLLMNGFIEESIATLSEAERSLRATGRPRLEGTIHNHLGLALGTIARYREATTHLETAVTLLEQVETPAPIYVREPLFNLVSVAIEAGWWDQARDALRRVRSISDGLRLEADPIPPFFDLLEARIAAHGAGRGQDSRALAWALARRGLTALRKSFAEDHPTILEALDFQAETALGLGDHEESRRLARKVLESRLRSRPDHPFLARTLRVLGAAALHLGDEREAGDAFQRALKLQADRDLGPWEHGLTLHGLARVHRLRGEEARAREMAGRALKSLEAVDSPRAEAVRQEVEEILG